MDMLNDSGSTETYVRITGEWTTLTVTSASVPFIRTPYIPIDVQIEYSAVGEHVLPTYRAGDDADLFFRQWDETDSAFTLVQTTDAKLLVPAVDKSRLKELHQAAAPLNLQIVSQRWDNTQDSRPLQTVLRNSDVLLGLDDPDLYNPKTAKNLLLSSYSRQVALVGPNAAFVRAGSLASTYSDQPDWLAILDQLLDRPPATWPRTLYPDRFKVSSNAQVARSLGIEPIDEASVARQLAEGERHP